MSIALVQAVDSNVGGTSTTVVLTGVSTGNLLIVTAGFEPATASITGISDGVNTYSKAVEIDDGSNVRSELWYAKNVTGGNITAIVSYSGAIIETSIKLIEFSGADTASPIQSTNSNIGSDGPVVCPSLITTHTNDALITSLYTDENCNTVVSPWTGITSETCYPTGYYIPGVNGSYSMAITFDENDSWAATGAVLNAVGSGPSPALQASFFNVF